MVPMSQLNVDVGRAGVAAINETFQADDIGPWARHVEERFEADAVLEASDSAFTEGEWRGHAGAIQFVANPMDVLEKMWIRADEVIDVDDQTLVVVTTFGGHARLSGLELENSFANVFEMHAGKVRAWRVFETLELALEAIRQDLQPDDG
jgi:ketosteroid isomerase-like protein